MRRKSIVESAGLSTCAPCAMLIALIKMELILLIDIIHVEVKEYI